MEIISCIIPMYNTQKYIKETLSSVLEQQGNFKLEIIVIDDGSTDKSVSIVEKFQDKHKNIILYQQRNAGPAVARNFAIKKASGKYIIFVDSDDILPNNAIAKLYSTIELNNSEITVGMFQSFNKKRTWIHESMKYFINIHKNSTNLKEFPELINNMSSWNKIYLRKFIIDNQLLFLENVQLREDIYFVCNILYKANKISIIPDIIYLYRARDEMGVSLTSKVNKKVFQDIFTVSTKLDEDQKNSPHVNNLKVWDYRYINELNALIYRLWPYIQNNNYDNQILLTVQSFLQKIDNKIIELLPVDKRIVIYKLKKGEVNLAEKLIKDNIIKKKSLLYKLSTKVVDNMKKFFWYSVGFVFSRILFVITMPKNIWLIGEQHGNSANDTGYEFFLYCRKNFPKRAIYFVTKRENIKNELKEYEKYIISYSSFKNLLFAIHAKVYIFSDSYKDIYKYYMKIKPFHYLKVTVFLQHGIFAFKHSEYYKLDLVTKRDEKFDIIVVSSKKEKKYVSKYFGFNDNTIAITGLSRFDKLYNDRNTQKQKYILFVPTWRVDLRYANEKNYLKSLFHSKILEFTENKILLEILEKYEYKLYVYFHHAASKFTKYYTSNKFVNYSDMSQEDIYHKLIKSSMLITDYSSIAFNMSYIDRPVAFYQFDVEEFLTLEGGSFIDYKKDLFGVVSDNPKKIIEEIEYNIKNDFKIRKEYKTIIDSFFLYKDNNNSKRIFDLIEKKIC